MQAIGLYHFFHMGLQMQQHVGEKTSFMHDWGCQVVDIGAYTLRANRKDAQLGFVVAYVAPEDYHHSPSVGWPTWLWLSARTGSPARGC